jgi:hypothetical protein
MAVKVHVNMMKQRMLMKVQMQLLKYLTKARQLSSSCEHCGQVEKVKLTSTSFYHGIASATGS